MRCQVKRLVSVGQGQRGDVTGARKPWQGWQILRLETAVMLQGEALLAWESRTGGLLEAGGDRGGEAGACRSRGRTWLLPAPTLQAPSSRLCCRALFGELKFQLL